MQCGNKVVITESAVFMTLGLHSTHRQRLAGVDR